MAGWRLADVGDQRGRVVVVTGGNGGIGFHVARVLAENGAAVVIAARNLDKSKAAAARITAAAPGAAVSAVPLDLASLDSVRDAADELRAGHDRIDLLVNNAGVNASTTPATADGFETQLGINHLGHFALTGLLLEPLLAAPDSRVVTVSSVIVNRAELAPADLDDLAALRRSGDDERDYARSKLANLLFAVELADRLTASGAATRSVAAHPGGAAGTGMARNRIGPVTDFVVGRVFGRTAERGALPLLRAATDPGARAGDYFGPGGPFGMFGAPDRVDVDTRARDTDLRRRLWAESERVTGVTYRFR